MKWFTLLLLLFLSCSNKLYNQEQAYLLVTYNNQVVLNESTLVVTEKTGEFTFSFVESGSKGLTPVIYRSHDKFLLLTFTPEVTHSEIRPNITYNVKYRVKQPGRYTVMFIWESKNYFGKSFIIHFEYKTNNEDISNK